MDANLTWAHSLDTRGLNQDVDTAASYSYNLAYDYGTSAFDRKVVFNMLALYILPFGQHGHGPLSYIVRDSPITGEGSTDSSGKCRARHRGPLLDGGDEFATTRQAWAYLRRSFAEMFPKHRCSMRCAPRE